MKRNSLSMLALVLFTFLSRPLSVSAEIRIATVDLNRILNESVVAKKERNSLDALSEKKKKTLETKKQSISALQKKIKEKGLGEDSKESQQFDSEVKDFNRLVKDSEDEVKKEFLKINKDLTEKALKIVNEYAAKKKLDLVIDKSERARGPVLFGDPAVDITSDVIKEMDRG